MTFQTKEGNLLWYPSSGSQASASLGRSLRALNRGREGRKCHLYEPRNNRRSLTQIPWSQGTSSLNANADATFCVPSFSPCLSHTALTFITTQLCSFWVFVWWLFWLASRAPCLQCCCTSWALTFLSLLQSQSSVSVQHLLLCLATVWMRQQM